jgi:hypothetical protein
MPAVAPADAGHDEHQRPLCQPAGQRRQREQHQSGGQHAAPPEQVGQPPAGEQQRPERQRVAGDHPLQLRRRHVQVQLYPGQRHVDDAEVELQHETARRR